MAKYLSKKFEDDWRKTAEAVKKGFPANEQKAAVFYEFLARDLALFRGPNKPAKLVYLWGKKWVDLPDEVRDMIVTLFWTSVVPAAVRFDPCPELDLSFGNSERMKQVWSKTYPLQFNLMASENAVRREVGEFFEALQKAGGYHGQSLERRRCRPLSFKPVNLLNRKLQGEHLNKQERNTIQAFRKRHGEEMGRWGKVVLSTKLMTERLKAARAKKNKRKRFRDGKKN
jgi:hypothetical protein